MAIEFVKNKKPEGILAVACEKELKEGFRGIMEIVNTNEIKEPEIVAVPLEKTGCVDTAVNIKRALYVLSLGCRPVEK